MGLLCGVCFLFKFSFLLFIITIVIITFLPVFLATFLRADDGALENTSYRSYITLRLLILLFFYSNNDPDLSKT